MQDERFVRIGQMVGDEGLAKLRDAFVTVVGLGAVGSFAVEALARSGVGRLRLVDFDIIRETNINRQLYALDSTVGEKKHEVARQRVLDINPRCAVESLDLFAHVETLDEILSDSPCMVIDAIDSVRPKVEFLAACVEREIPVVASMGAALRTDPTRIQVGPMTEVHHCPLTAQVRRKLRRKGIEPEIPCVYSTERVCNLPKTAVIVDAVEEDYYQRGRETINVGKPSCGSWDVWANCGKSGRVKNRRQSKPRSIFRISRGFDRITAISGHRHTISLSPSWRTTRVFIRPFARVPIRYLEGLSGDSGPRGESDSAGRGSRPRL